MLPGKYTLTARTRQLAGRGGAPAPPAGSLLSASTVVEVSESDVTGLVLALQQCELFALPNRTVDGDFEGFGMVLIEAQACGRPVLAGASGGTAEAVRAGETGVIVDCTRAAPLADALAALLDDHAGRARMGQAARHFAVETFDFDRNAERAAAVLARVKRRS